MISKPLLLITMGDVAGVGPEIIAEAWPALQELVCPVVIGDPDWMVRGLAISSGKAEVVAVSQPREIQPTTNRIPCLKGSTVDLSGVCSGVVGPAGGRAAYDFLCTAIDLTLAGAAAGIVTAPLHKEGLHAAGLRYPGHTEILAERTGTKHFAMMLLVGELGVAHVTLHMALRDVFRHLTTGTVLDKIGLLDGLMRRLLRRRPRLGVAALNPHASDGGLFGNEEKTIIQPAIEQAVRQGIDATGPWPADTLFVRASRGEFDAVVAMYHDQGHIALKLLGGLRAVNVSLGLPLVRTSVAHGTAYDIAGKGLADPTSLIEATRVAVRLIANPA